MRKFLWVRGHIDAVSVPKSLSKPDFIVLVHLSVCDRLGRKDKFFIKDEGLYSSVLDNFMELFSMRHYYVLEGGNETILKIFPSEHEAEAYIAYQKALDVQKELTEKMHQEIATAPVRKRKM